MFLSGTHTLVRVPKSEGLSDHLWRAQKHPKKNHRAFFADGDTPVQLPLTVWVLACPGQPSILVGFSLH